MKVESFMKGNLGHTSVEKPVEVQGPDWLEDLKDEVEDIEPTVDTSRWIDDSTALSGLETQFVSAALAINEVVEGGFVSSLVLAPFKALFWGVTFLLKLVGLIALVLGIAVASPLILVGFGAFVWYLTNKVRNKFKNMRSAANVDAKKTEAAREFAPKIASALHDPRVVKELQENPKAASAVYDTLESLGQHQAVASAVIAVASADILKDEPNAVKASWEKKISSPSMELAVMIVSTLLGGFTGLALHFVWFLNGLYLRKWRDAETAKKVDKVKFNEAKKAADIMSKKLKNPKVASVLNKNPEAAAILHEAVESLTKSEECK